MVSSSSSEGKASKSAKTSNNSDSKKVSEVNEHQPGEEEDEDEVVDMVMETPVATATVSKKASREYLHTNVFLPRHMKPWEKNNSLGMLKKQWQAAKPRK
jgi:hypothetical protein